MRLVPVHSCLDNFESATYFFPDSQISTSTRIRIQIKFAHPHVSDTNPDSLSYQGLLWEYWQQSMRRGIHSKELDSILLRRRIKKYPDLASTRFRIHSVVKNFHSGERIQKVVDSYAGFTGYVRTEAVPGKKKLRIEKYPDTSGRGLIFIPVKLILTGKVLFFISF